MCRRAVIALLVAVGLVVAPMPAGAATDPVDSQAPARIRVSTSLVGLAADLDGGRVDLSANGQFVLFDRPGSGIGLFDSVLRRTTVLGAEDARPFAVSASGVVALYTSEGQPFRWDRTTNTILPLPWSGGLVTDMATSQSGDVIAYSEQTSGSTGILRTWSRDLVDPQGPPRVRTFSAEVTPALGIDDRDVFVTFDGRTAFFRSGGGVRSLDVATSAARFSPLSSPVGLDRTGSLQVENGDGPERFRIGDAASTERTDVNYPAANNGQLNGLALAGDGSSVVFHSGADLYRWKANGELHFLQPTTGATLGNPRDASITGRFVLTSRPGATNGILEIIDVSGPSIPIVVTGTLQGPQLSDQIRRLYLAYFNRGPDAAGLQNWLVARANGGSLNDVSAAFAFSAEFRLTYGALGDGAFVDLVYQNVLGRAPDAAGRAFWIGRLADGASRGALMTGFSEGQEFRTATATSTPSGALDALQIERLYRAYFNRPADQGGLDFWLEQFAGGAGLGILSQEFARSTEFGQTYGALDDGEFVDLVYQNVLGRAPDAAGRAFWVSQLTAGVFTRGQVMIGFSESAEFIIATDTLPPSG